ncbi:monofunctional biosynthetic peptidoglycan transglycosylase [Albimonas donghaensis]|uniref:Biosynthetic peptidoglycan transglycosylase n=1 Tax=Albimonas donghaensis TaxID=356660 RepID=A0A1H3E3V9_9RHOB|nr:monofunctional biosynthetic peptidoglycan transglycosylase [Albimonas donghaensis]SDX73297.1 monofunctional biosynthetic peptidoglycan transglycosylase [Albimonas donghaensis]
MALRKRRKSAPPPRRRGPLRRLARGILQAVLLAGAVAVAWVALYRVVPPPTTFLIESERLRLGGIRRDALDFDALPDLVRLAFPAAEDARFCTHHGLDAEAIRAAFEANAEGKRLRGGSTISQQVAKNAFLWPGRNWLRKGLETGFALLAETLWPKRRMLEIYLNVAEMGEGVFGLEAAAQTHFGVSAGRLSARQAALIAAALPNPKERDPARPSGAQARRAAQIVQGAETLRANGAGACVLDG